MGAMRRRNALGFMLSAAGTLPLAAACRRWKEPAPMTAAPGTGSKASSPAEMPAIFIAHGSPLLLDDADWVAELRRWADALPRPRAVLMLSAHWEEQPITLGATTTVPLVYDFYGFPERYYEVKYAAPGAPELAARVRALLGATQAVADSPTRGLDHGAYVPLVAMYPNADVPVLQVSLPTLAAPTLFALGRALAPLRREGILVVGSGFLTHNMRALDPRPDAPTPSWASDFDAWAAGALARHEIDALLDYRNRAPGVREALPTHEHFVPVVVAAGATADAAAAVKFPITGFMAGSFTRRSVQFG
jgi:4,5-DOPA dioxygenase extradiol